MKSQSQYEEEKQQQLAEEGEMRLRDLAKLKLGLSSNTRNQKG